MSSPSRFAPLFGLGSRGAAAAAAQTTAPSTNTAASSPAKPHAPVVVVSTSSGTAATDAPATVNTTAVVAATSTATAEGSGSGSGSGSVGGVGGGGGGGEGGGPGAEDWERPERAKEAWRDVKWLQHVALESLRPSHLLRLTPEQLYTFLPILANLVTKAPTSKAPGSQVPTRSEWETAISSAVWGNRQVVSLSMFAFWLNRAGTLPEAAMTPPSVESIQATLTASAMSMRTPPPPSPSIKNATAHVPVPTTSSTSSPAETSAAELEAKRNRILKTVPILQASHRQLATFFDQCSTTPPKVGVDDLVWRPKRVYDPLFGAVIPIDKIEVIKVFDSQAKPCLMSISFSTLMPPKTFIYKTGDDLRKDLAVEVMFEVFNSLWDCSGLTIKPHAFTYYVVPTGPNRGLIEFIENSVPVTKFVWENISTLSEQDLDRLIATAAGGYVAVFVLGIRDRHRDNMLIKNNNIFFQIDFGYVFNMKPWFDANRLAFASEFKAKLIERKAWERFIRICIEGWLILRRCSGLLINLCERLFAGILEDPVRMCSSCLHDAFFLDQCEPDACISVNEMLESGVTSVKKMIKDIQHNFLTGTTHTTTAPSSIAPPATTTTTNNNNNTPNTRAQPTGSQDTSRTGH